MLSYSYVNTIILGVALKPWDPDKDLKSILISELLMDKPPLLSWHSNQHTATLISLLKLSLTAALYLQDLPAHQLSVFTHLHGLVFSSAPQSHPTPHCYSDGSHRLASKFPV